MLQLNSVKERLLFLSPVVQAGWEKEASISDFDVMANLGQGAFGLVTKVQHKKSQVIYAIKQMDKKRLKNSGMIEQITTEIKIMYSLNHENIVKLFNHFEDDTNVYLIIDYAPGGQLWNKLQKSPGKRLPEKEVAVYVKDLVSALEYLHGKGIIHRDIKPENLLIDGKGRLKLADFGWSNYFKSDAQRTTFCGTLDYLAPEMVEVGHQHDHMVDIWAVGVLTYELLTGKSPFSPLNPSLKLKDVERGTQQNIVAVKFDYPKEFPPLAKDLVSKILRKNPKTRLNLFEIKTHPWVKCTAFVVKKKELDPKALIEEVTFGQNMAEKNNFAQLAKDLGIKPAFTEEEIIQIARPDSMLDKVKFDFQTTSKTLNLDKQIEDFKKQMGLYGGATVTTTTATTANVPGTYFIDPSPTNAVFNNSGFSSGYSDDMSPTKVKNDLDYRLKIKSEECEMLQQEVNKLKKAAADSASAGTSNSYIVKAFEEENASLKAQLADLKRKLTEKDAVIESTRRSLEDKLNRETHQYGVTIKDLEYKLKEAEKRSYAGTPIIENGKGNANKQTQNEELQEINDNLNAQISEYNKLIKRLYDDPAKDGDAEKKRMLEDIKTLRSLSSIKQDRIERLEAKVKSLA